MIKLPALLLVVLVGVACSSSSADRRLLTLADTLHLTKYYESPAEQTATYPKMQATTTQTNLASSAFNGYFPKLQTCLKKCPNITNVACLVLHGCTS